MVFTTLESGKGSVSTSTKNQNRIFVFVDFVILCFLAVRHSWDLAFFAAGFGSVEKFIAGCFDVPGDFVEDTLQ